MLSRMPNRRDFLAAAFAAPLAHAANPVPRWSEIEKKIASGAVAGMSKHDLPTPALIVDLDAFESNIGKLAAHVKSKGRALRPHAKTHKSAAICGILEKHGAIGHCAAKISEAEALAGAGVRNLLLTSAPIGPQKMARALRLAARQPETIFSVDNAQHVRDLNDAAGAAKLKLHLAIDLFIGGRTGIQTGAPAVALAELIASLPNVKLKGLQSYAGQVSHTRGFANRRAASLEWMGKAVETRRQLEAKGVACGWLSGGSTGTYNIDSEIDGVTELQPGSFMFMDAGYARIGGASDDARYTDFAPALFVLATVISRPNDEFAICDAGYKAFATDSGPADTLKPGLVYGFAGDEHGKLKWENASGALNVGDRLQIFNPHCDPTVNLYDRMFACRGDKVEAVWKVTARGMTS
jgi:3-hydroxy-D-aspartate aldolase